MNIAQESTKQESKKNTTDQKGEDNKITAKIFQGIGVVCGRIITDESQKTFIEIEGEAFKLTKTKFIRQRLDPYIEKHPDKLVYLRVYPSFNIKTQRISFHAIGFNRQKPESRTVNQFILAGVWQYIKQLPEQPVISIYRNNLRRGETAETIRNSHVPVYGFTEPAYSKKTNATDSKQETAQDPTKSNSAKLKFYELLVTFNPQQKRFDYLMMLDSTEDIPPHVKSKYKKTKNKSSRPKPSIDLGEMNFSVLQKTAIQLREAGFLEGKVSGKGITKETLSAKVQESLNNNPKAKKVLLVLK